MIGRTLAMGARSGRMPDSPLYYEVLLRLHDRLTGRQVGAQLRLLRELQWWSPAALEARAMARLRPLLEHAVARVPLWRERFAAAGLRPADIESPDDLGRLPLLTKADLRARRRDELVAANLPARRRQPTVSAGSTGTPFAFFADRADLDGWLSSFLFFREWAGSPASDTRVRIASGGAVGGNMTHFSRALRGLKRLLTGERLIEFGGMNLTLDQLVALSEKLARGGRYTINGYPSYLARLAAELDAGGRELAAYPRVIVCGGETMTPLDRVLIERGFRCRVLNQYSCWEVPHLAQTCPDNPGLLHVNGERAIVRIVRPDGAAARPGERGRVVLTVLGNYVQPFINYDLGDLAVAEGPCPCGRGLPAIRELDGRGGELIRTPDGRIASASEIGNRLIRPPSVVGLVREFQALQTAPGAVTLRVVPTADYSAAAAELIRDKLRALLGAGLELSIEPVERIAAEPSGKRLVVKSTAPPDSEASTSEPPPAEPSWSRLSTDPSDAGRAE